jgi:hypothetical protein
MKHKCFFAKQRLHYVIIADKTAQDINRNNVWKLQIAILSALILDGISYGIAPVEPLCLWRKYANGTYTRLTSSLG